MEIIGDDDELEEHIEDEFEKGLEDDLEKELGDDFQKEFEKDLDELVVGVSSDDDEMAEAKLRLAEYNAKAIEVAKQLQLEVESKLLVSGQSSNQDASENKEQKAFESDYDESGDEIHTPPEGESKERPGHRVKSTIPEVNAHTDFKKLKWCVGIRFPSREAFRDCMTRYSVVKGRNVTVDISDNSRGGRLRVKCIAGCPFRIYGSRDNRSATYLIKSVDPRHTCNRNMNNSRVLKSSWLAKQFLDIFKSRPHWPAEEIIKTVKRTFKIMIERGYAYKIKYHAHRLLHGSMKEHYSKIGSYLAALHVKNKSSFFTLLIKPAIRPNPPTFHRLFVCFDALKQGWIQGCRKVLCVDACFLKTFLGGQLISAIGRDANEQMYPLAWAVVEGENNDSYQWFFKELKRCLGEETGEGWTVISDEHQSIVTMVKTKLPLAEHRHCARHIFAHWHKSFRGDEMKQMFWACCNAYSKADFKLQLKDMRKVDPKAVDAFLACNPSLFYRAFIKTHTTNDVIVSNMAETFNAYIISARTKHIIYMLEEIRVALMQRLVKKKSEMEKKVVLICPRVQVRLEKEKELAAFFTPFSSSENMYEVQHYVDGNLIVDLAARTCTCRSWDLTGIPCAHVIAAQYDQYREPEDFVADCFKKDTYLKIYSGSIGPCSGEKDWPEVKKSLIPPAVKVGPERPRKNRRKDPFESTKKPGKLTKTGLLMTCSVCKSATHNKRKCPDKDKAMPIAQQLKRGRGRPKSTHDLASTSANANDQTHHGMISQPTRIGKNGRVISNGKGSRGGKGGKTRRGGRGDRAPQGYGFIYDNQGVAFTNEPIHQRHQNEATSTQQSMNQNMST